MIVFNRAAYEEPSWFPAPHPDAELSNTDIKEETEAEMIFALDAAEDRLYRAEDRLDAAALPWETKADIRAELVTARAHVAQVLDVLDPNRKEEPRP